MHPNNQPCGGRGTCSKVTEPAVVDTSDFVTLPLRRRHPQMRPVLRLMLRRASLTQELGSETRSYAIQFLSDASPELWAELEEVADDLAKADDELTRQALVDSTAPNTGDTQPRAVRRLLGWAWEHREELLRFVILLLQSMPK